MTTESRWDWREWRADGSRPAVYVEAVDPMSGATELIAHVLGSRARQFAEQIVHEHSMLSAPYADEQHLGGHWLELLPQKPRWAPQTFSEPIQMALTRADSRAELLALRERIDQRIAELDRADEGVVVPEDEP